MTKGSDTMDELTDRSNKHHFIRKRCRIHAK